MRRKIPTSRPLCIVVLLVLAVAVVPFRLRAGDELEQHLSDQYKGKTLLLRNFYSGDSLRYDASGKLSGKATSGDWTVDGIVQVDDVKVSNHRLTFQGKRLHMGWAPDPGFALVPEPEGKAGEDYEKSKKLRIEADLGPGEMTRDSSDALVARIFLTPQDRFVELVPDYWKPCVRAGLTGQDAKPYKDCRFPPAFLAIPGANNVPEQEPRLAEEAGSDAPIRFARVGNGVTVPKALHHPDPAFAEEARRAKYQGVVTLMLVVDKTGSTRNIRIVSPLGCGLDKRAVEAVSTWKFGPAEKDGEPVNVEIAVEVDFHLY
jgi:TonB family protein